MPEVDEATLAQLRGAHALLDKMLKDPKTRRDTERAVKAHQPNFPTVDEALDPVNEKIESLTKKFDQYLEAERNAKQDREAEAAFSRLQKAGYTEDGIGKIKNLMRERTIPDVDAAAALFDKLNPPAPPVTPKNGFDDGRWGFGIESQTDPDDKLLFENEDRWAEREAAKAWRESAG